MRNLLLGNGFNMHLDIKNMSVTDIRTRFQNCLVASSPIYELLFDISLTEEICNSLFQNIQKNGIESLTEIVHSYILENTSCKITLNLRMRLLDALICSALTAIFFNGSEKIGKKYNTSNLPNMNAFDNIFTLNYAEFWDNSNRCIFLHGKYDIDSVPTNNKPLLLYSHERYCGFENYASTITKLKSTFNTQPLNTSNIIFSPEFSTKSNMIALGRYPSENLYPANDLFLHQIHNLYTELDNITTIEIFGMSPYGDDSLIEKLNQMEHVIIYVYNKNNNIETKDWSNILKCPHTIKDSTEIMFSHDIF